MELVIISPLVQKTYTIEWLEIETTTGNRIIKPKHAPALFRILPHTKAIVGLKDLKQEIVSIKDGFVHVTRAQVTLVLHG